ncbi:MAG: nucleotidyltransferase domain-containing protein [Chloroflexi bacterium]|nr:nucleotidyltransferase domain-containing protein [Chloroflexota bacterium]
MHVQLARLCTAPQAEVSSRPRQDSARLVFHRRGEMLRLPAARGAHNGRVFGSVARGQAGPESDVDFLDDLKPHRTLFDFGGLILDLEEALGRKVDVVEISAPSRPPARIQREAVPPPR